MLATYFATTNGLDLGRLFVGKHKMADDSSGREVARENEDEDSGLSMLEVLEEENQLEEDAIAVLGDSDDKNCTYLMVNYTLL